MRLCPFSFNLCILYFITNGHLTRNGQNFWLFAIFMPLVHYFECFLLYPLPHCPSLYLTTVTECITRLHTSANTLYLFVVKSEWNPITLGKQRDTVFEKHHFGMSQKPSGKKLLFWHIAMCRCKWAPDWLICMVCHGSIQFKSTDFFLPLLRLFFLSLLAVWGLPCRRSPG